ncbi:ATP-binding response regulator [Thiothrix eikelboomii]|nr:ATP-binding protein [Thiothrix eikelboomii]
MPQLASTTTNLIELPNYMGLALLISVAQSLAVAGIGMRTLATSYDGLNSPSVLGMILFYMGLVLNVFMCPASILIANLTLIIPLLLFFAYQPQDAGDVAIAVFLLLLIIAVLSFAQLQRQAFINQIEQKIQLEKLSQALNLAKEQAEQANLAKSYFFTSASHDARQPLQAISLLSESLLRSTQLVAHDRQVIEKIVGNLHSIRNLFNRVLDISHIESGKIQVNSQAINLAHTFHTLATQYGEMATHKNIWLHVKPTHAFVSHDAELLLRILGNLIHNAIQYTEHGGVWVAYRPQRECIEIRDSGIGIDTVEHSRIFQDFYQLNNSERNRDTGKGVGLGLSIVQRLAALTDTRIQLVSALGKGTIFRIYCKKADAPPNTYTIATLPQAQLQRNLYAALRGTRLLYVEDDAELRELFSHELQSLGIQMVSLANFAALQSYIKTHPNEKFDALLTDYRLPEAQTGTIAAVWLRHYLQQPLPVLILTGDTQVHAESLLAQLQPYCLVQKPIKINNLLEKIYLLLYPK